MTTKAEEGVCVAGRGFQFIDLFDNAVPTYRDLTAIESARQSFTFEALHAWSVALAHLITEVGASRVKKSGNRRIRVSVAGVIDPIGWACVLGAARAGALYVPINVRNTAQTISSFLQISGCDLLFFADPYTSLAESIAAHTASTAGSAPALVSLAELDSGRPPTKAQFHTVPATLDDLCRIAPTGGTTGAPKAVMMSHQTLVSMALAMCSVFDMSNCPVFLAPLPLTHATATFVPAVLMNGGRVVLLDRPDPAEILQAVELHRVTHLYTPPTLLYRLLDHPDAGRHDYRSLRHLFYGAAPTALARIKDARRLFGSVMSQFYGQVEAPQVVTLKTPREHEHNPEERLRSCGRASPVATVEIHDGDDEPLAAGERGEICVRGPLVMKGYLNDPAATSEVIRNGWLHTGDVGYLDEAGYVYIVDRIKDMIISGGFNVYCSEVEAALMAHPQVRECTVFGVPSAEWGEAVKAAAILRPDSDITEKELIEDCKSRIGSVKAPKSIDFVDDFPLTAVGKVDKKAMKAREASGKS